MNVGLRSLDQFTKERLYRFSGFIAVQNDLIEVITLDIFSVKVRIKIPLFIEN